MESNEKLRELIEGSTGWYSYDLNSGEIIYHEYCSRNDDDTRLWFCVSERIDPEHE